MATPLWYPDGYCSRYGWQWCSDPYDGPPHYPAIPKITVVDASVRTLGLRRKRFWKAARDAALLDWEVAGLLLPVTTDPALAYQPGYITLVLTPTADGTAGMAAFGLAPGSEAPMPGAGWAHIDTGEFEKLFASKRGGSVRAIIGHEIGHTFGFGHAPPRACMDIDVGHDTRPNVEELKALNDYFFGGGQ